MKRAFTLIELLIVVAIIAILAAIAVPNFLEAQTRARVARVYSDLRTLGICVNSYQVDNAHNPPGFTTLGVYGNPNNNGRHWCYKFMTTPVSYMATFPQDPFNPDSRPEAKYYFYNDFFDPSNKHTNEGAPATWIDNNDKNPVGKQAIIDASGFKWGAYSAGPQRAEITPSMETAIYDMTVGLSADAYGSIYDPTNGTVSRGRIAYSNKGFLSEKGY